MLTTTLKIFKFYQCFIISQKEKKVLVVVAFQATFPFYTFLKYQRFLDILSIREGGQWSKVG